MRETNLPAPLTVYRLRVVVRGVSPLIWRRLLVPADTTIAGLHAVLQIAFSWTGTHLHRFVVQGREYGIGYVGGPGFGDDPRRVRLGDLGLRRTERFTYHYDFTAGWCLDLRVEQVLAAEPGRPLPVCAGGRRAGPPEDCGGVQAFLESTQPSHVLAAAIRAVEILSMLLDDEDVPRFGEHRDRLSHVAQNYVRAETLAAANGRLITAHSRIAWPGCGAGGLLVSVDGLRFVVPVRTLDAGPNPHYFGRGRGVTWLNAINDQVAGIGGVVVTGTMRDSLDVLDVLDVILGRDGGPAPEMIATDTASYSEIVFGLFRLLGYQFSPRLADLPDQRLLAAALPGAPRADYGPMNAVARHHLSFEKIRIQWPDMLRVAGSLHTGTVACYDLLPMLGRDGNPSPLGAAFAEYCRAAKTLHLLAMCDPDDETYRRAASGAVAGSGRPHPRRSGVPQLRHAKGGRV